MKCEYSDGGESGGHLPKINLFLSKQIFFWLE